MYNAELKKRFTAEYTKSSSVRLLMGKIFNQFEPFEQEYQKDLCQFDITELQAAVDNVLGLRSAGRWSKLSHIRSYIRWCTENKVAGSVYCFDKLNIAGIEKFKNSTVANEVDLQRYLDAIYAPEDEHRVDSIIRAYVWLAFCGIPEAALESLTKENIILDDMIVSYDGMIKKLYPEALKSIRDAMNLTEFFHDHKNYQTMMPRFEGNRLLRLGKSDFSVGRLRTYLTTREKKVNDAGTKTKNLSYGRIYLSGMFYRIYKLEMAGMEPDFTAITIDERSDRRKKESITKANMRKDIKAMREDYNNWKFSHGYK